MEITQAPERDPSLCIWGGAPKAEGKETCCEEELRRWDEAYATEAASGQPFK